jgi:transcriptional regulator with XRE-family HTH domain
MRQPNALNDLRRFNRNVLALRLERGWTQKELARQAGLSASSLSRYAVGSSVPNAVAVSKLAARLGKTSDELWHADYFSEHHIGESQDEFMDRMRTNWARIARACERAPIVALRPLLTSEDVRAILLYPSLRTLDRMRESGDIAWTRVAGHLVRFTRGQVEDYFCGVRARPANPVLLQKFGISVERIAAHEEQRRIDAAGRHVREMLFFKTSRDEARARAKAAGATANGATKAKKKRSA